MNNFYQHDLTHLHCPWNLWEIWTSEYQTFEENWTKHLWGYWGETANVLPHSKCLYGNSMCQRCLCFKLCSLHYTMASFGKSCPKIPAWNSATVALFLLQLQKLQNLVINPQFWRAWEQEFSNEWKSSHQCPNSCHNFRTDFPKTGHSA